VLPLLPEDDPELLLEFPLLELVFTFEPEEELLFPLKIFRKEFPELLLLFLDSL